MDRTTGLSARLLACMFFGFAIGISTAVAQESLEVTASISISGCNAVSEMGLCEDGLPDTADVVGSSDSQRLNHHPTCLWFSNHPIRLSRERLLNVTKISSSITLPRVWNSIPMM